MFLCFLTRIHSLMFMGLSSIKLYSTEYGSFRIEWFREFWRIHQDKKELDCVCLELQPFTSYARHVRKEWERMGLVYDKVMWLNNECKLGVYHLILTNYVPCNSLITAYLLSQYCFPAKGKDRNIYLNGYYGFYVVSDVASFVEQRNHWEIIRKINWFQTHVNKPTYILV